MFISIVLLACNRQNADEGALKEAALYHNRAVELVGKLEKEINHLEQSGIVSPDSLTTIRLALNDWEADLVEVPGNESHEHTSHEHHHHAKPLDLTPGQMVDVQKALFERVQFLEVRLNKLKKP